MADPVEVLTAHGLPLAAARRAAAVLTGRVAATMQALLPGLVHAPARRGLRPMSASLGHMLPGAAQAMIAELDHRHATAAAIPMILLDSIVAELDRWHSPTVTGPASYAPSPAQPLVAARYEAAGQLTRAWTDTTMPTQVVGMSSSVRALARGHIGPGLDRQWTGWALLAALTAMDTHRDALPLPPTASPSPAVRLTACAIRVGWNLALTAALGLIADGEQDVAAQAAL